MTVYIISHVSNSSNSNSHSNSNSDSTSTSNSNIKYAAAHHAEREGRPIGGDCL